MKYRVDFQGTNKDWFIFGCDVEAPSEQAAKRKAIKELEECRGKSSFGNCVVNKR